MRYSPTMISHVLAPDLGNDSASLGEVRYL
jgi:hypothetical protein